MTFTQESAGLRWINNLNMATFGSLVSQLCWMVGSFVFTGVAAVLMLRWDYYNNAGTLVSVENNRQLGYLLATALLFAWTGKTVAGVFDNADKRGKDRDFIEAKERGKATGAVAAASLKATVTEGATTREHAALEVLAARRLAPKAEEGEEQEWAQGDSQRGRL